MNSLAFGTRTATSRVQPSAAAASFPLPLWLALSWALGIGLAKSTQYLFQPFVWANWSWYEVLYGWMRVARDDVLVADIVAVAMVAAGRVPVRTLAARAAILAVSIAAGALAGELVLRRLDARWVPHGASYLITHAAYWVVLAGSVAALYYVWRRNAGISDALHARELQLAALRRAVVDTHLQTLRNQIEPHFLFNTLATIRGLHQAKSQEGAALLRDFLDFLRLLMSPHGRARNTLGQEVELARAYLGVVVVRMSGRLKTRFDIDDTLAACEFPALALGTLVENAVKHGVAPKPDGGTIAVRVYRVADEIEVEVTDSGIGFTGKQGTGIGLVNIRTRLRTQYGARGRLELAAVRPNGVRATIRLPFRPVSELSR